MNVQGLDKARILKALYNQTKLRAPMAVLTGEARGDLTNEEAQRVLDARGTNLHFDYLFGRLIKVNLGPDVLDLRFYDRDNGPGAGENVILEEFTAP